MSLSIKTDDHSLLYLLMSSYFFQIRPGSPTVEATTELFHPNICNRRLCISLEGSEYSLELTVLGILYLLHSPQYDDPFYIYKKAAHGNDYRTIRLSLTGRDVGGAGVGPRYIEDDEEILQFLREIEDEQKDTPKTICNAIDSVEATYSEIFDRAAAPQPSTFVTSKEVEQNEKKIEENIEIKKENKEQQEKKKGMEIKKFWGPTRSDTGSMEQPRDDPDPDWF